MEAAPKASSCILGGTREIFDAVSEDFSGGAEKAEDAKLPGAGIIRKLCSMERAETETMDNGACVDIWERSHSDSGRKRGKVWLRESD